jgi:hypothetical protein
VGESAVGKEDGAWTALQGSRVGVHGARKVFLCTPTSQLSRAHPREDARLNSSLPSALSLSAAASADSAMGAQGVREVKGRLAQGT